MISSPPAAKAAAAAAALSCLALLVTACGSASPSAATGGTPSSQSAGHTPSHTDSSAGNSTPGTGSSNPGSSNPGTGSSNPGTGTSTTTGTTSAESDACATSQLKVATGGSQGTAGSVYVNIDFTNVGRQACTLYGYPGVSFVAGSHAAQVGPAASRMTTPAPVLLTLDPGQMRYAVLRIVEAGNYSPSQCHPVNVSELRVYPPNQTQSVLVPLSSTACAGSIDLLSVSTVES
jgi:hypothetical protein